MSENILVELIQSNKGSLHPISVKFLFYLASICLQAAKTVLHCAAESVCTCVHTCWCFEGDVLSQSLSDVSYISFIAAVLALNFFLSVLLNLLFPTF